MILVPFEAEHVDRMRGARTTMPVTRSLARAMEGPHAMTAFDEETMEPMAAAGTAKIWDRRYHAWVIIGQNFRGRGASAVRLIRRYLETAHPVGRVEAAVEHGWTDAHRFVRALGFEVETHNMPRYLPNGRGAAMYVRQVVR